MIVGLTKLVLPSYFMSPSKLCCICDFGFRVTLLLPRCTAVRPNLLLLATEAKNNCTYAFLPEKQFGN